MKLSFVDGKIIVSSKKINIDVNVIKLPKKLENLRNILFMCGILEHLCRIKKLVIHIFNV